jgi:zinc and cadmium transporter
MAVGGQMFETWIWSLLSVLVVSLISLIGILTLALRKEVLNKLLLFMVSFSAGGLLGDAFLHLLPEAADAAGLTTDISIFLMSGIAFGFVTEKFICWRHCHVPTSDEHPHKLGLMNLFGDGVHNFIDGLIIGGSYVVSLPLGITSTMAVILHEIPQEIGDFGVLVYAGYSMGRALLYNFITALTAFVGAAASVAAAPAVGWLTEFLIPFSAGTFVYIACADLIPELQRTRSTTLTDSVLQLAALALGVAMMLLLKVYLG